MPLSRFFEATLDRLERRPAPIGYGADHTPVIKWLEALPGLAAAAASDQNRDLERVEAPRQGEDRSGSAAIASKVGLSAAGMLVAATLAAARESCRRRRRLLAGDTKSCVACDLAGHNLRECDFNAPSSAWMLRDADLTSASFFRSSLQRADFSGAKLVEADLNGSTPSGPTSAAPTCRRRCSTRPFLPRPRPRRPDGRAARPGAAQPGDSRRGHRLAGTDMRGARLAGAKLAGANFRSAKLDGRAPRDRPARRRLHALRHGRGRLYGADLAGSSSPKFTSTAPTSTAPICAA